MKKVVSITLFGADDSYAKYLSAFVVAHHNLFPLNEGWVLRVHVDPAAHVTNARLLSRLCAKGLIELTVIDEPAVLCRAMLWRVMPVFDRDAEYVFCRDLDALPLPRDRAACEEFMESELDVHTILDAPVHGGIMGGLCGFHARPFREKTGWSSLDDLFAAAGDVAYEQKGADQNVLNQLIGQNQEISIFEHCYSGWANGCPSASVRPARRFPTRVAVSKPAPNEGWPWVTPEATIASDALAAHMGAAGYDIEKARRFYEDNGFSDVHLLVAECER